MSPASEKSPKPKPAKFGISGYGLIGNLELNRTVRRVGLSGKKPEFFDSDFVEDTALIVGARVRGDGYLEPKIIIRLKLAGGREIRTDAESLMENPLPRDIRIVDARFIIHRGTLYYFNTLEFQGLETVSQSEARGYFQDTEILLRTKRSRLFTQERLRRGISSLTDVLDRQGYRDVQVTSKELGRDDKTGAMDIRIEVVQGPKYMVHSVLVKFSADGEDQPERTRTVFPNRPYSRVWEQDFSLGLKTNEFRHGYPDTSVKIEALETNKVAGDKVQLDLQALVNAGLQVHIGKVEFEGQKKTRVKVMERRVRVRRGELLDRIKVEEGRFRLAQLGIFDTVELDYHREDEHTRDVIYRVKEGKQLNVSILFGYGSYELLRGGVEVEENNLWGLGHRADFKAIQSFKSSSGEFTYTIPDTVPDISRDVDLFLNASGLRRQEVSFLRVEYGGGVGLHKYFQPIATDIISRYNYQILSAQQTTIQAVSSEGLTNPAVGSITFELKHDRRDNPLYPHKGYKIFATIETATKYLGGDANYERIQFAASKHFRLGGGRYLSFGLSQGVDVPFGSTSNNLPFNKRFFPGGADSIRGYPEDQASPRNAQGQIIGAETYTLGSVQLEQALTPRWSLVIFSDNLGLGESISNYPFETGLFSVGGGINWRTLIGPVRLEYGYNLNPPPQGPTGTLQFSLGFPF
jgi:outer membrane protein assembly complex protein YaeT